LQPTFSAALAFVRVAPETRRIGFRRQSRLWPQADIADTRRVRRLLCLRGRWRSRQGPSFKMQGREGIDAMVPKLSRRGTWRNRPMRSVESGVRVSDVFGDRPL